MNAIRQFRRSKPWRGTLEERIEKFKTLHIALCAASGIEPPPELICLHIDQIPAHEAGDGAFISSQNRIVLVGRLSVTTYLYAFARARGRDPREALSWAFSIFARSFPRSFANSHFEGLRLVKNDEPI